MTFITGSRPRNLRALEYWIAQGGRFTVATGRAHRTFAPYAHLAPINAPVGAVQRFGHL